MSQINGIQNGPNINPADGIQVQGQQAGRASSASQGQRISDIVENAEVLPPQQPRVQRSTGQKIAYVLGRVLGGVLTLGVSELVISWRNTAEVLNAEALRQQALERKATAAQFNEELGEIVDEGEDLPEAYQAAAEEAVEELRERFGDIIQEDATGLDDLPCHTADLSAATCAAIKASQDEVTPQAFRNIIVEKAAPLIARHGVELALDQAFQKLGFDANPSQLYSSAAHKYPDFVAELSTCHDRAAVDRVVSAFQSRIDDYAAHIMIKEDTKKIAIGNAIQSLADRYGVSAEAMRRNLNIQALTSSFTPLKFEVDTPAEEILKAYMGKVEKFLEKKFALLDSMEQLPVSDKLKAYWKNQVLTDSTMKQVDIFTKAEAVVSKMPANKIQDIEALFKDEMPDAETVFAALQSLSLALHDCQVEVHGGPEAWYDLGGDGWATAQFHAAKVLLDRMPALQAALENNPGLIDELNRRNVGLGESNDPLALSIIDDTRYLIGALTLKTADNANLAASISQLDKMPVPFLAALNHAEAAVRANFAGVKLPENMLDASYRTGSSVKIALTRLVQNSAEALTPAAFAALAERAFGRVAAEGPALELIRSKAEATGIPISEDASIEVLTSLLRAQPDLLTKLAAATDVNMIEQALADVSKKLEALILEQQQPARRQAALDQAVNIVAERLNISTKDLNWIMAEGHIENFKKSLAEFTPEGTTFQEVSDSYAAEAHRLAEPIIANYEAVGRLALPIELDIAWKELALKDPRMADPAIMTLAKGIADTAVLNFDISVFKDAKNNADNFYLALGALGRYMERTAASLNGQDWARLGTDGQGSVMHLAMQALMAKQPALREIVAENEDILEDMHKHAEDIMAKNSRPEVAQTAVRITQMLDAFDFTAIDNHDLDLSLNSTGTLPAPYLQALNQAEADVRQSFAGVQLPDSLTYVTSTNGNSIREAMKKFVQASGNTFVTPEAFAAQARLFFNRVVAETAAQNMLAESIEHVDVAGSNAPGDSHNVTYALKILVKRHPELALQFSSAQNTQEVRDILNKYAESVSVISSTFANSSKAWVIGEQHLFSRMAEVTGFSEAEVRVKFKTHAIKSGSTFGFKRQAYADAMADPNQPLASAPRWKRRSATTRPWQIRSLPARKRSGRVWTVCTTFPSPSSNK